MVTLVSLERCAYELLQPLEQHAPAHFQHSLRVHRLGTAIGQRLREAGAMSSETLLYLELGLLLHDVGKGKISAALLHKQGALTAEEYGVVREHVRHGIRLCSALPKQVRYLVGSAHEWATETKERYPRRGSGTCPNPTREEFGSSMHKAAQVVAVADCLDAYLTRGSADDVRTLPGAERFISGKLAVDPSTLRVALDVCGMLYS